MPTGAPTPAARGPRLPESDRLLMGSTPEQRLTRSRIGIAVSLLLLAATGPLMRDGAAPWQVAAAIALGAAGMVAWIFGWVCYAAAKGRHPRLGLLSLAGCVGVLVLLALAPGDWRGEDD